MAHADFECDNQQRLLWHFNILWYELIDVDKIERMFVLNWSYIEKVRRHMIDTSVGLLKVVKHESNNIRLKEIFIFLSHVPAQEGPQSFKAWYILKTYLFINNLNK